MRALLVQLGLLEALKGEFKLDKTMIEKDNIVLLEKTHIAIVLSLGHKVLRQVSKEKTAI